MDNDLKRLIFTAVLTALTPAFLLLFRYIFNKIFPKQSSSVILNQTLEELTEEFKPIESRINKVFYISTIISTIVAGFLLPIISQFYFNTFVGSEGIFIHPKLLEWMLIAPLVGILIGMFITNIVGNKMLEGKIAKYTAYMDLKLKINSEKFSLYGLIFYASFVILLTAAFFDYYSYFGENEIKISSFLSFGASTYQFQDVDKIVEIKSVELDFTFFDIYFKDGRKWHSVDAGFNEYEKDLEIVNLILRKANIEVETIEN